MIKALLIQLSILIILLAIIGTVTLIALFLLREKEPDVEGYNKKEK